MKGVLIIDLDLEVIEKIQERFELNSIEDVIKQEMNWVAESGILLKDVIVNREEQ